MDKIGDAIYDFSVQDPVSFARMLSNPAYMHMDPDVTKFFNSFMSDNLRDFGLNRWAARIDYNTDIYVQYRESIGAFTPIKNYQAARDLWKNYLNR